MDAFAWGVVGSVAGVVAAAAAIVFGVLPLVQGRRKAKLPRTENRLRAEVSGGQSVRDAPGNELPDQYVQTYGDTGAAPGEQGSNESRLPGGPLRLVNSPLRNPAFTGRTEVLEELGRRLTVGPVAVVAVRGLGGVGKSQVALEYAYRMCESGRYEMGGWVRADSAVTVVEDLAAMAPLLGIDTDGPTGELAAAVVTALGSRRNWLVVFDNAEAPRDLAGMIPSGGDVLITSRNRQWGRIASQLDLKEFTRTESVAFLGARSNRDEPAAAAELAEELGDLPLALAQAAAYIDTRAVTVGGYLTLYRDPALARRLRDEGLESDEYPASVARTWLLSMEQLASERPAAVELLRLCAFLDSDDIDLEFLTTGAARPGQILAATLGDPLERAETAGALARASLATVPAQGRLRVHRLVQAVTRDQLDDDQAAAWVRRALDLVLAVFPDVPDDPSSWPICASLAPHAESIATHAESYSDLAAQLGGLLNRLGIYLTASAQLKAGLSVFERALAIEEAAYGPDHLEIARTLANLGLLQRALGELPTARAILERVEHIFEAAYGPDDPEVARTLANLGNIQLLLGELPAARENLERALAIEQAIYGPDHPEVAGKLADLGIVEAQLGELTASRASLERALAIEEAAYGPDHPEVGRILANLGIVEAQLGELSASRASLERALAIEEAAYGPDHPEVGRTLASLANIQRMLGELPAARVSLERALAILVAVLGPGHPDVAIIKKQLVLQQQNEILSGAPS